MRCDISDEHYRICRDNHRINKRYMKTTFGRGAKVGFHIMSMLTHDDQGNRCQSNWPTSTKRAPWAYSLVKWSLELDRGFRGFRRRHR